MAVMEIAIDLGTSFTSIYLSGSGVVLREPSVIAVSNDEKKNILGVGYEALSMRGKQPDKTLVIFPIQDGYVYNIDACKKMLGEYIKRILPVYLFYPKIKAILGVPGGLSVDERNIYEEILNASGISEVNMVENSLLSAIGFDLPISIAQGALMLSIGAGVTEIAVVSLNSVLTGCSLNIGGNMMDRAIVDFIAGKYGLKVGLNSVKALKEEIASLIPFDVANCEIKGVNTHTLTPSSVVVYANDIYEALIPYYEKILEAVESIINTCPAEISADIHRMGMYICGGASALLGLEELVKEKLNIDVTMTESPELTTILGAGKLLSNKDLLISLVS